MPALPPQKSVASRIPRVWVVALFIAAIIATVFAFSAPLQAQEGEEYDYVDLVMIHEYDGIDVVYSVRNVGTETATGVTVSFHIKDMIASANDIDSPNVMDIQTDDSKKEQSFTWSAGTISAGGNSGNFPFSTSIHTGYTVPRPDKIGVITATASSSQPEPDALLGNNEIIVYSYAQGGSGASLHMSGNRLGLLLEVSDLRPAAGGDVNFDLTAQNMQGGAGAQSINLIANAKVKVELSDGLGFKSSWTPPSEFATSGRTATWSTPDTDTKSSTTTTPNLHNIEIEAQLTTDSLASIPLEERCITAWVVNSIPPPSPDFALGRLKQCLGDDPPVLFEEGPIAILTSFPCTTTVGPHQCQSAPGIAIAARVPSSSNANYNTHHAEAHLRRHGVGRRDTSLTLLNGRVFLDPESVFIQVKDPQGRVQDSNTNRVAAISWQTARDAHAEIGNQPVEGVAITYTRRDVTDDSAWNSLGPRTLTVSGVDGGSAPGGVKIRVNANRNTAFDLDSSTSHTANAFNITSVSDSVVQFFAEFETLGTYLIKYDLTMTDSSTNDYTDTGTYTFHVGPIAELEVRDAGASPAVSTTQRAFTIVAVNNGPDIAPAAQVTVTGLNSGDYSSHTATKGTFDSSTGVWTIGELITKDVSQPTRGRNGEVLTIITTAAVDTGITAAITNTQDYQVCIDSSGDDVALSSPSETACTNEDATNTWHSTGYYDYNSDNSTDVTIQAKDGTGADLPSGLSPEPIIAAIELTWDPVTEVNGRRVTHYEVQRQTNLWKTVAYQVMGTRYVDTDVEAGDTLQYRVRAVNDRGQKGPWSQSTEGMAEGAGLPGVKVSVTDLELTEGGSGEYTVVLKARPIANVRVNIGRSGDVSPRQNQLTFTPSNWFTPQTVTLNAGQDNDAVDDIENVTHTISSSDGAYAGLTVDPVAVTVIDDDSGVSISAEQGSVNEGEDIVLTLTRTGNTTSAITVTVNVSQSGDYLASGQSGTRTVNLAANATSATITVETVNDTTVENPGTVFATVAGGASYFASPPSSVSVQVQDDDGPPGQPGDLTAVEDDERVKLSWTAAPTGDAPVLDYSYRVRRYETSTWDPDWTIMLGSSVGTRGYTVYNLTNGQQYVIQVRARNATGDGAAAEVKANPKDEPGAPDVTVASRNESLLVTWSVPDDGGRPATDYRVQWKSVTQSFDASRQAETTGQQYTIPSLTNGTEYQVRVQAKSEVGWGDWSGQLPGTPTPRPATTLSITTDAQDGVGAPFRVTFTFTDEDHDGTRYGVTGFDLSDTDASYGSPSFYEFTMTDFKAETPGRVYSALVNQIIDGKLTIRVPANAAQSTEDGQQSAAAVFLIEVDAPEPEAPTGTDLWSAEMTVGDYEHNARGYIDTAATLWSVDETIGSLSANTFTYAGKNYLVGEVSYVSSWDMVVLVTCPGIEGADGSFDLYLDDQHDGDQDHSLSFDPDGVRKHTFSRTLDGVEVSCIEYAWVPKQVDSKVNVRIVK